jgi:DNA-binding NarL/FixJ family response regulator
MHSSGKPADILTHCRTLGSCVLVIDSSFVERTDSKDFADAVDFGGAIRVLVELEQSRMHSAERLIRMGCAGCVSTTCTRAEARSALRTILRGELWASRKIISDVLMSVLRESRRGLTWREQEIVSLLGEGLTNSGIAERLFISPQTVRWHLRGVYNKLGTHDRRHAVVRSMSMKAGTS